MILEEFIYKWGSDTVEAMKRQIANTVNYSGIKRGETRLHQQFNPKLISDINKMVITWELELPEYAKFVDEGRPPGGFPPEQPIMKWILNRNIRPKDMPYRNFLYVTRRLIAERGVKGSNFMEVFDKRIERATLDKGIDEYIIGVIDKKLLEIKNKVER